MLPAIPLSAMIPFVLALCSGTAIAANEFNLVKDYSGANFFNDWNFYDNFDNYTNGDIEYQSREDATSQGLATINAAGRPVIRVDNASTVVWPNKRNSVYITSIDTYDVGSLIVADFVHMPFGCGVWPAFWMKGTTWPQNGEIDIVENVNLRTNNQMALHTNSSDMCIQATSPTQLGTSGDPNCTTAHSTSGCTVTENKPNSFGAGFASNGGGVFAMQFDVTGIFIWFFPRDKIPQSISGTTSTSGLGNITDFGNPSASYPASSCDITKNFGPQQLVFDITACGDFAGTASIYNGSGCLRSGPNLGTCYLDQVIGNGSNFDDAYFEVNYVRAYAAPGSVAASASTSASSQASGTASASGAGVTAGSGKKSAGMSIYSTSELWGFGGVLGATLGIVLVGSFA